METTTKKTAVVDSFINLFDDKMEENAQLTTEQKQELSQHIDTKESLEGGITLLLKKANNLKENVDNCDKNIKTWQESKKLWDTRSKTFLEVLGMVVQNLNIPGQSLKSDGVKLTVSKRTSLEVDEDWLLGRVQNMCDALQKQLPEYMKVTISIDKNKLKAFLDKDNSMLINYPEKIHSKVKASTTIK